MRHSEAPSMRAASSSSLGTESMFWRMKNMPRAFARPGRMMAHQVFGQAEVAGDQDVLRDDPDLEGDRQGDQDQGEDGGAAGEGELGQRVAAHRAHQGRDQRVDDRDADAVGHVADERQVARQVGPVGGQGVPEREGRRHARMTWFAFVADSTIQKIGSRNSSAPRVMTTCRTMDWIRRVRLIAPPAPRRAGSAGSRTRRR
jgi:hypothetical protein